MLYSSLWGLIAATSQASLIAGIYLILTRWGSAEQVGEFTFALALAAPVYAFFNLQLRSFQVVDVNERYAFQDYFNLRIIGLCLSACVIGLIISLYDAAENIGWMLVAVVLFRSVEFLGEIFHGQFQRRRMMRRVAASQFLRTVLSLCFATALFLSTHQHAVAIAAVAFASGLVMLIYDARYVQPSYRLINFHLDKKLTQSLFKETLPLGAAFMLLMTLGSTPRIVLEHYEDMATLGVFGALAYLTQLPLFLVNSWSHAGATYMARAWNAKQSIVFSGALKKLLMFALCAMVVTNIAGFIWGQSIIRLLFGSAYAEYEPLFHVLMAAAGVSMVSAVYGSALTSVAAISIQPKLYVILNLCALSLSVCLIPEFGLLGAAWTALSVSIMQAFSFCLALQSVITKSDKALGTAS